MKKINSLVALVTSLIMTAPLVSTAFADTVSGETGSITAFASNAGTTAVTQEAVPPKAQASPAVPAVTTAPLPLYGDMQYTTTTMTTPAPLWPEIHFEYDGAGGHPGDSFTFTFQGYDDGREYGSGESPIRFTVSDESIARITKVEGMKVTFEMLAPGSAVLRGTTPDGRYTEAGIDVWEDEPVETEPIPEGDVEFSKDTVYLDAGETVEIETIGYTGNLYDEYDGTHHVNLYCLDNDIVRVVKTEGNKFTLEGVSTGYAYVYAELGPGNYAEMRVFVKPLPELMLSPERVEIYPEDYYQISLKGYVEYLHVVPAEGTTVKYEFDDPSLVEVINESEGCIDIKGVASGSTVLHATVPDGRTTEIPITILPDDFRFEYPEYEWFPDGERELLVRGGDAVFSVPDDGIIEVISTDSRTMKYRTLTPGETTVTATCGNQTITARITVMDPEATRTTEPQTTTTCGDCWWGEGTTAATETTLALWRTTTAGTTTTTAVGATTAAAGATNENETASTTAKATTTTAKATATTAKTTAATAKSTTTAATVTTTIPTEDATAPAALRGNVTGDGKISVDDAQLALKAYTERIAGNDMKLTAEQIKAADVDGNGEISVEDAQLLLKYYTEKYVAEKDITWTDILGNKAQPHPALLKRKEML